MQSNNATNTLASSSAAENTGTTPEDAITISAALFRHVMEATELANEVVEACGDDTLRAISEFTAYLEHRCSHWDDSWNVQVDTTQDVDFALVDADKTAVSAFFRHMKAPWDNEMMNYHRFIEEVQRWFVKVIKTGIQVIEGGAR